MDVKTAFLTSKFPDGVRQFVRRPHGVPSNYFPPIFELGSCVYGHPAFSHQFEEHNKEVFRKMGFTPMRSTPSMFQMPATSQNDQVICSVITDDCVFAAPYDSPTKDVICANFGSHYDHTIQDPLVNINGVTIHRDRAGRRIGITQPLFLDNIAHKYSFDTDTPYPTVPFPYSTYLSTHDRTNQSILLPDRDIPKYQAVLGDILWLQRLSKPEIIFASQHLSRISKPTLYDYNLGLLVLKYCVGTKDNIRWLGGPHGPIVTASVDSSFASHPDLKSQSCWTVHIGGGGATICDAKKQSITADSSTAAEVAGNYLAYPDCRYTSNILEELGFPQPSAMGIANDNQSTMKLLNNPANKGKTRHLDLRFSIIRENIENSIIRLFYLPTEHMIADIGTKALSPMIFHRLRDYLLGTVPLPQFLDYIKEHAPHFFDPTFSLS